uniref:Fibrillin 1 n=1 Tax=Amphilophus citrinellus TaxID=61819 RepID=A0A3Q0T1D8_AMPCI
MCVTATADSDECAENSNLCENGHCLNLPGGFRCECDMGFITTPDGKACEDINECADPTICINGMCVNIPGSYHCNCPPDFELNPTRSTSFVYQPLSPNYVDECERPGICGPGQCYNTIGNYTCICPVDYMQVNGGNNCMGRSACRAFTIVSYCFRNFYSDNRTCDGELTFNMTKKMCCCSYNIGRAWNKPCEQCPVPSSGEVLYSTCAVHASTRTLINSCLLCTQMSLRSWKSRESVRMACASTWLAASGASAPLASSTTTSC